MTTTEKEYAQILENIGVVNSTEAARLLVEKGHLTCAPEESAPGVYLTPTGVPMLFGNAGLTNHGGGMVALIGNGLEWVNAEPIHTLTPARVVPAEPVELSEADLEAAYPHDEPNAYGMLTLDAFGDADRRALVRMCQTLVDKHGTVRVASRDEVLRVICRAMGEHINPRRCEVLTDAVMALLGGDRG